MESQKVKIPVRERIRRLPSAARVKYTSLRGGLACKRVHKKMNQAAAARRLK